MSGSHPVLDARARALAAPDTVAERAGELLALVTFTVERECYGLEARYVREIIRAPELTPVPGTSELWLGVMSLRGELLPVVDLRKALGASAAAPTAEARVLVLGERHGELGVLADAVHEVTAVRQDELLEAPAATNGAVDLVRAVTSTALAVLDGAALLADPRFVFEQSEDGGRATKEGRS
ncbi:MAG: chemotaxis protein CheW [Deltaproteobacteria bacterium]|nr:chemotaxis protein CheW [Deltaproteobacteria bacterium]